MLCRKGYALEVLLSGAGYYIGTIEEYEPNCRISENYYKTREEAQKRLNTLSFEWRDCIENQFCNGGHSCIPVQADESTANHI